MAGCIALESIQIPAGMRTIANHAFCSCKDLKLVDFSSATSLLNSFRREFGNLKGAAIY